MTSALQIPALVKMHQSGHNPLVLRFIEENAIMQAVEMRMTKGINAHPADELVRFASTRVPQGLGLHQLYAETKSAMRDNPAQELSLFSEHLERVAGDLEFAGARLSTTMKDGDLTVEQFARAQTSLAERYADIIDAASAIEKEGGPSPIHMLGLVTERPVGPLEPFYDKARALLVNRAAQSEGLRNFDSPH